VAKRFMLGFATGYVLGTRAGEKRYQQIAGLAQRVLSLPMVEGLVGAGREAVDSRLHELASVAERRVHDVTGGHRDDDGDQDGDDAQVDNDLDAGDDPEPDRNEETGAGSQAHRRGSLSPAAHRPGQNPSRLASLAAAAIDRGRAS